jgi:putative membrane-bound dehydrogenase-like protein
VDVNHTDAGVRFGIIATDGFPSAIVHDEKVNGAWHFDGSKWVDEPALLAGLDADGPVLTSDHGIDRGVRLHDLDNDGRCELLVGNDKQDAVFAWDEQQKQWLKLPFALPAGTSIVDSMGRDAGLRLVDIDGDGHDDILFSNDDHFSLHLFRSLHDGWSKQVRAGKHGAKDDVPPLVRNGTNNGAWLLKRHLWIQNEDTADLPDMVDRRSYAQLLDGVFASAHSPQASLRNIELRPGFKAELAAAEPLVEDPIAVAWGPDGRCWVVEMSDYPLGVDGKRQPGGRIKILEDTKGDGHYTKATLFLDKLPFPTGVLPWGKGVLITDAPNILYAEDTKRDGKADVVKVLFTGFVEGNQQHRANGLQYGLDNWVYGANGHSGGLVKSMKTGEVVDISGRDFRIKPDEGLIETTTGITQFGRSMDDWGNWFGCDNSNPAFQFVLDEHYLRRNPHFVPPAPRVQVSDQPGASPVFPISPDIPRFNDYWALHHFTSACGVIIYRDNLFGPLFYGNSFVSEPVGNLVHREIVRREGTLFQSSRAADEQTSEFLASSDGWFRPTTLRTGPDGALWVVDMYRLVIEHPQWIPKEWQEKLDLRSGSDMGRIYRVFPINAQPRPIPRLDQLDDAGLVAALDSPSGWQRDTAQQLLIQRHDPASIPLLEQTALHTRSDLCLLHVLCTLDGLGVMKPALLEKALSDPQPGIRRHAVRLSESQLAQSPSLGEHILGLISDPDAQVRMQVAYSLGEWDDPRAGQALGRLAAASRDEPYVEAAAMTSLTRKNLTAVLSAFLAENKDSRPSTTVLANFLRFAQSVDDAEVVTAVLNQVSQPQDGEFLAWQFDAMSVLLDASDARTRAGQNKSQAIFDAARALAQDTKATDQTRVAAIGLLGRSAHRQEDLAVLFGLLTPQSQPEFQSAAARSIGRLRDMATTGTLLGGWRTYGPSLRSQVLDILINRPESVQTLIDAVERKQVLAADIDPIHRQRLLKIKDAAIRERADKIFASVTNPDRQKVVDAYQPALKLGGDPSRGAQVFARVCAACHQFGGVGNPVGPDLASIGDKSPETLLVSILDPNRAVEPRYVGYVVETSDGNTLSGVLGTETATSITLLQPTVSAVQILRTGIKTLRSTGLSLMPEGLDSGLSQQDLADLIAHIRSVAPPQQRKEFPGNQPKVITSTAVAKLHLPASACEIFGSTVVYEPKYGNLGYWHSPDDSAVWTVQPVQAGKYEVWIDYACDGGNAANSCVVQAGSVSLTGKIESTGSWDNYRQVKIGEIELVAGAQRITFRSRGAVNGYLCDLRGIELVPVQK